MSETFTRSTHISEASCSIIRLGKKVSESYATELPRAMSMSSGTIEVSLFSESYPANVLNGEVSIKASDKCTKH